MAAIDRLDADVWEEGPDPILRDWAVALVTLPFFIASQLWRHLRHRRPR